MQNKRKVRHASKPLTHQRQDGLMEGGIPGVDAPPLPEVDVPPPEEQEPDIGIVEPEDFSSEAKRHQNFYFLKKLHGIRASL